MTPKKETMREGTIWYVAVPKTTEHTSHYVHSDGVVRFGCMNPETGKFTGHFKTREAARRAIRVYKAIEARKNRPNIKAVVEPLVNPDGSGCVRFEIVEGPFGKGSEPIYERTYEETLLAVGMVLERYKVTEIEWKG
jgi:hypothetical protein